MCEKTHGNLERGVGTNKLLGSQVSSKVNKLAASQVYSKVSFLSNRKL